MPIYKFCERAGFTHQAYSMRAANGTAPAPIRGIPYDHACAILRARGITTMPPPAEFIRQRDLCVHLSISERQYLNWLKTGRYGAVAQTKGIKKAEAEAWLKAWNGVAAAKERLAAATPAGSSK
jgi:hypothetical protein